MNVFFYGHYYVKLLHGKEYYFFYDSKKGICYKQKDKKDIEILLKNGNRDFSIDVANNTIHLICSDTEGSLIYLCMEKDDKWSKYVVLKNKNKKAIPEYFSIHVINNWINVFYTLFHNNKTLLVHHIINNQNTSPNVIDYVAKNNLKYSVYRDDYDNILLFYFNNNSPFKFGLRKYEWSKKNWSSFHSLLDNSNNKIINPYVLVDKDLSCHITYLQKNDTFVNLMYCKIKDPYNLPMENPTLIKGNIASNNTPIILGIDNKFYICWKSQTNIYSSSSEDDGATWSKPSYYLCAPNSPLLINFKSEIKEEKKALNSIHCYGYVDENIYLHLISDYIKENLPPKTNANNTTDIKSNKYQNVSPVNTIDIEKIKISQTLLQNNLNNLNKRVSDLEKQLKEINNIDLPDESKTYTECTNKNNTSTENKIEKEESDINTTTGQVQDKIEHEHIEDTSNTGD